MKSLYLLFFTTILTAQCAFAQWTATGNNIYNSNSGNVGIGTSSPNMPLEVNGAITGAGIAANIDTRIANRSLSFLENTGKMLIGWNRTQGAGETDFISNQANGTVGGFAFYDHSNQGVEKQLLWIVPDGRILIGAPTGNTTGYKLAVAGNVIAEGVTVKLQANWPDYVFKPGYHLPALSRVKSYISENRHLPELPSENEVGKNGINLGEMNKLLTKKVEELTLYLIKKDEEIKSQDVRIKKLEQLVGKLMSK